MEEEILIDQSPLAESIADKIPYAFFDLFLIKPLDPVKVKKEVSKPVAAGDPKKDQAGIEATDFNEVETEIVEVNSDYRKGIVLKRPTFYDNPPENVQLPDIKVGSVVLFRDAAGLRFDLVKDSRLLKLYDILGTAE